MQRELAGTQLISYGNDLGFGLGIGLGAGLVAGVIGMGQWVLTAHDLDMRLALFDEIRRLDPSFWDGPNVAQGNEWFWVGTAAVASLEALFVCMLAAYLTGWAVRRRSAGVVAALVAAAVGVAAYAVATQVALQTSPEPDMTQTIVSCVPAFGVVFVALVIGLAPVGAVIGVYTSRSFPPRRPAM